MATELKGKTALITDAAQGLGTAIAQAMYYAGARVVLTDISETVNNTAAALDKDNKSVLPLQLDVSDINAFEKSIL
ncbi:MAG: SDR family NAD(P)-dependent oxidoreductase [Gammaproteobacteria bacterium]|nr:SDR family NAD(P)-dependent oxidoreductase [Gammaproteobacteria bacterium]